MANMIEPSFSNRKYGDYKLQKNTSEAIKKRQEGNKKYCESNHNEITHHQILELYTESAALAENNSEELALAYSNRSAFLLHLKKYNECLVDIDRASAITKSDELLKKITNRKAKCLESMKADNLSLVVYQYTPRRLREEMFKDIVPNMKPSKKIPCASEFVSLRFNEKYGRHVVANDEIKPGTVIVVEKGSIHPMISKLYTHCYHCLNLAWNGIPCETCTVSIYCSEDCKKEAWSQYHDIECSILPKLLNEIDDLNAGGILNFIIALTMFIKCVKKEGLNSIIKQAREMDACQDKNLDIFFNEGIFQSENFKTFYNLSVNKEDIKTDFMNTSYILSLPVVKNEVFKKFTKKESVEKSVKKIMIKLMNVSNNNVNIVHMFKLNKPLNNLRSTISYEQIGIMIASFGSFFNHSCDSNIERAFFDGQVIFFTIKQIKKGEQLFMSYGIGPDLETKERKEQLLACYAIKCDCPYCKENWFCKSMPKNGTKFLAINNKVKAEFKKENVSKTMDTVLLKDEFTFNRKVLHDVKKMLKILRKYYPNSDLFFLDHALSNYVNRYMLHNYAKPFEMPTC